MSNRSLTSSLYLQEFNKQKIGKKIINKIVYVWIWYKMFMIIYLYNNFYLLLKNVAFVNLK